MSPFSFSARIYFVAIKRKQLAKIYAAKFLACNDVLWVAEELYSIMEESIAYDSAIKQETTKEFLVDIIEIMTAVRLVHFGSLSNRLIGDPAMLLPQIWIVLIPEPEFDVVTLFAHIHSYMLIPGKRIII